MANLLSFTWSRDPQGYVFKTVVPNPPTPLPPGTPRTTASDVSQEPYRVLAGVSDKLEDYSPLEGNRALFQEIANCEQTEVGVLLFAGRYGSLTDRPMDFDEWLRAIQDMGRTVKWAFAGDVGRFIETWNQNAEKLARAHLRFLPHGRRRPTLQLVPRTLFDAAIIQLGQAVAGDQKMLVCDNCGRSFLVGTATSRRATSKFCGTTSGPTRLQCPRFKLPPVGATLMR